MRRPPKMDLDGFLPYRLTVVAERLSVEFSRSYSRTYGLTVPEWRVLFHLSQTDEVSVRDIEKRAGLEKSKVSRVASRLEAAGYVSKAANTEDRRLVKLALTDAGRDLMAKLIPLAVAHERKLEARLGDDLELFMRLLQRLENDAG